MEYVEKAKWPTVEDSTHEYKSLDEALQDMERNEDMNIVSSELFDENNRLIATFRKGEGVKMVKQIEEVEVSERTFNFMKDRTDYFNLYDNWKILGSEERDLALSELNHVYYNVSSLFTKLIKSEVKLVKKAKEYRIILKGLHRFEGVQTYSEYVYLKSDGTLAKTKSFDYITVMSEKSMKQLPEWAQALAEEVK